MCVTTLSSVSYVIVVVVVIVCSCGVCWWGVLYSSKHQQHRICLPIYKRRREASVLIYAKKNHNINSSTNIFSKTGDEGRGAEAACFAILGTVSTRSNRGIRDCMRSFYIYSSLSHRSWRCFVYGDYSQHNGWCCSSSVLRNTQYWSIYHHFSTLLLSITQCFLLSVTWGATALGASVIFFDGVFRITTKVQPLYHSHW